MEKGLTNAQYRQLATQEGNLLTRATDLVHEIEAKKMSVSSNVALCIACRVLVLAVEKEYTLLTDR